MGPPRASALAVGEGQPQIRATTGRRRLGKAAAMDRPGDGSSLTAGADAVEVEEDAVVSVSQCERGRPERESCLPACTTSFLFFFIGQVSSGQSTCLCFFLGKLIFVTKLVSDFNDWFKGFI